MTSADTLDQPAAAGTRTDPEWWRSAVVYQIYPRSFADADGNGVGDLPGITSQLPALADLGVDAVWLSPFYTSPQADAGYDVADYRDVDPIFGTLADFDAMAAKARELGLRLIVDLVPNHSSDEHPWFQAALRAAPGSPERARYLFRDGRGPNGDEPPNNWRSVFGGPAWTRVTEADGRPGQWYLHLFDTKQPDFDWTNEEVKEEFRQVLRFWLDRGVDGFRVDVAHGMVKQAGLPDEAEDAETAVMAQAPVVEAEGAGAAQPGQQVTASEASAAPQASSDEPAVTDRSLYSNYSPAWDQDGVHEIYRDWRRILDEYPGDRMMVAEAWVSPLSRLARYIRPDEMQQAFNFEFLSARWDAKTLRTVIDASLATAGSVGAPSTWVLSNHDVIRHASRFGIDYVDRPNGIGPDDPQPDAVRGLRRARAATLMMLALPGSAYLYQGEELGLPDNTTMAPEFRQDPVFRRSGGTEVGRDGCRVPISWQADAPALGFNETGKTWLPQPDSYRELARDQQAGKADSTLEMYRAALRLRKENGLGDGALQWAAEQPDTAVAFSNAGVGVVANLGDAPIAVPAGEVLISSGPLTDDGLLPPETTVWVRT